MKYGKIVPRYTKSELVSATNRKITSGDDGVSVNSHILPNTQPLTHYSMRDPVPVVRLTDNRVAEHEALFVSARLPRSYDARYFGEHDMRQVVEVVVPV